MSTWQRARRNAGFSAGFSRVIDWLIMRNFAALRVRTGITLPMSGGYIGVANHHAWWDGFAALVAHRRSDPTRRFAIMMSDRELRRFPYFRMAGAFSVDATSVRTARDAILYAAEEAASGTGVWILPDGILRPPQSPLAFTSGFVHAARRADVPIIPLAVRYLFLGRRQPEMLLAIGDPIDPRDKVAQERTQRAVEQLLKTIDDDCVADRLDAAYAIVLGHRSKKSLR